MIQNLKEKKNYHLEKSPNCTPGFLFFVVGAFIVPFSVDKGSGCSFRAFKYFPMPPPVAPDPVAPEPGLLNQFPTLP